MGEEPPPPEPQFTPQPKPKRAKAKPPTYESGPTSAQIEKWEEDYIAGTEVVHKQFGHGCIVSRTGSVAVIVFDDHGVKRVELLTCLRKGLIRLAGL